MDTSDIIEQLSKLQLEQNSLIAQLIKQNNKESIKYQRRHKATEAEKCEGGRRQ